MFPVNKQFLQKYHPDKEHELLYKIIQKNKRLIIEEAQQYLDNYQNGIIPVFSTQIERIYQVVNTPNVSEVMKQVASGLEDKNLTLTFVGVFIFGTILYIG
jgi:hypothetical protein